MRRVGPVAGDGGLLLAHPHHCEERSDPAIPGPHVQSWPPLDRHAASSARTSGVIAAGQHPKQLA
jgi:hypothetical protein